MRRRNRQNNDPRWITARYTGTCHCGRSVNPGDLILYFPIGKSVSCQACGKIDEMRIQDEELNAIIKAM